MQNWLYHVLKSSILTQITLKQTFCYSKKKKKTPKRPLCHSTEHFLASRHLNNDCVIVRHKVLTVFFCVLSCSLLPLCLPFCVLTLFGFSEFWICDFGQFATWIVFFVFFLDISAYVPTLSMPIVLHCLLSQ